MIFNNADNIMYGEKEVDRVFYGKNLVWERGNFYWISDRQTQSICGYKGVPTSPVCYLNWNQKPTNVSRPFPDNAISVGDKSHSYNIFGDRFDWDLYESYDGFEHSVSIYNGITKENPYRDIFANTQLLVNYNSNDNKSYCNTIGYHAFTYGILGELTFQNCKIKMIGGSAFAHFSCSKSGTLVFGDDETDSCTIDTQAFWHTDWDLKIIFDCSKITWGYYSYPFSYSNISEVIFSKDVEEMYIPTRAFYYCENLQNVALPNGITEIKDEAFYSCENLTNINIPNTIKYIRDSAFGYCENLNNITIPESVTTIGKSAFASCYNLTEILIPNSVTQIGDSAFNWCTNLKSAILPDKLNSTGNSLFFKCEKLTNVIMPTTMQSIGDSMFGYCRSLLSIEIPNSVTNIGESAFTHCESLTSIEIPNSVTNIEMVAFEGCYNITSFSIPSGVTAIKHRTFAECNNLTSITIPVSVCDIAGYAFDGSRRLSDIYYTGTEEQWNAITKGEDWLYGTSGNVTIHYNS